MIDKEQKKYLLNQNWTIERNKYLRKTFCFQSFSLAIKFISDLATFCDQINHHPDWCNSYDKIKVSLTTHRSKGLTNLDFYLAQEMEKVIKNLMTYR